MALHTPPLIVATAAPAPVTPPAAVTDWSAVNACTLKWLGGDMLARDKMPDGVTPGIFSRMVYISVEQLLTDTKGVIAQLPGLVYDPYRMRYEHCFYRYEELGAPTPALNLPTGITWAGSDDARVRRVLAFMHRIRAARGTFPAMVNTLKLLGCTAVNANDESGQFTTFDSSNSFDSGQRFDHSNKRTTTVKVDFYLAGPAMPVLNANRVTVENMLISYINWLLPYWCRIGVLHYNSNPVNLLPVYLYVADADASTVNGEQFAGELIYQDDYSPALSLDINQETGELMIDTESLLFGGGDLFIDQRTGEVMLRVPDIPA